MADMYNQGVLTVYPWLTVLPRTMFGVAQQWYPSRTPFTSRIPEVPVQNITYDMITYQFRPRLGTVAAAALVTDVTITLGDASMIMNGDRLLIPTTGEVLEVTGAPTLPANTVPVRRGAAGTTAAAIGLNAQFVNIGNTRTGGEKFQNAIQQIPKVIHQNIQQYQHVVSVSGVVQAINGAWPLPPQAATPFKKNQQDALQNLMDDLEVSMLYGRGEAISTTTGVTRGAQTGVTQFLATNARVTTALQPMYKQATIQPTNPTAYTPSDFIADVIQPIRAAGGNPTVMHVSTQFMTGLAVWGMALQRFTAGVTPFGVNINYFIAPFLGDIPIVENMWLNYADPVGNTAAAVVLTESEVRQRVLESLDYKPYARVGDTGMNGEGDWIHRGAIEVDNEPHHGMVIGISGFAPQPGS
jgi:hypothetical protein